LEEERRSLVSQGESWSVVLMKKEVLNANAIPKVNPSDRATVVSKHGENTPLLSLAAPTETITITTAIIVIVVNDVVGVRRTAMADRECYDSSELESEYTLEVAMI
jgi:hypothetical protein